MIQVGPVSSRGPQGGRQESRVSRRCNNRSKKLLALKKEEVTMSQGMQATMGAGKGKGTHSPLKPLEGNSLATALILDF